MTTKTITTYTCDVCGQLQHDLAGDFSCCSPMRWAQVEWTEPPEDGKEHRQWKRLDLCPDHLNSFLKWVTEQQQERSRLAQ